MLLRAIRFWVAKKRREVSGLVASSKPQSVPVRKQTVFIESARPEQLKEFSTKDLVINTRWVLNTKEIIPTEEKRKEFWLMVQNELLRRIRLTTNEEEILGLSLMLQTLVRSREFTANFQTQFALLLPYASPKSLFIIGTTISKMGGMTPQFLYILKKQYNAKKDKLTVEQRVMLSYSITKAGGEVDQSLVELLPSMSVKELSHTMRMFDKKELTTPDLLNRFAHHFVLRAKDVNALDLSRCINVFFHHCYFPPALQKSITHAYDSLKENIDEQAFLEIWQYFPQMVDANLLNVRFTEAIIMTLKLLHNEGNLTDQQLRNIRKDIVNIQNIEVREKCRLK